MDFTLLLVFGIVTTIIFLYQNQQIKQLRQQIADHDEVISAMQFQLSIHENAVNAVPKTPVVPTAVINEQVQVAMTKTQVFDDIREIYRRIDGVAISGKQLSAEIQELSHRALTTGPDSNICIFSSFQGCPDNTHSWGGFSLEFDTTAGERSGPPGYVIGEDVAKAKGRWHSLYGEFCCSQERH